MRRQFMVYEKINLEEIFVNLPKTDRTAVAHVFLPEVYEEIGVNKVFPCVVLCPGGAYVFRSQREDEPTVLRFLGAGIAVVKVEYSCGPEGGHFPTQLLQVCAAIAMVRRNAEKWHIDSSKIAVMGYSAGGHLAASLSTLYSSDETRPDFQILLYPVISMVPGITHGGSRKNLLGDNPTKELEDAYSLERRVSPRSPQAFIVLSADDGAVPPMNSIGYFLALNQQKVPVSMHIYPIGGHGWGFRDNFTYKRQWTEELEKWLRDGVKFEKNN